MHFLHLIQFFEYLYVFGNLYNFFLYVNYVINVTVYLQYLNKSEETSENNKYLVHQSKSLIRFPPIDSKSISAFLTIVEWVMCLKGEKTAQLHGA